MHWLLVGLLAGCAPATTEPLPYPTAASPPPAVDPSREDATSRAERPSTASVADAAVSTTADEDALLEDDLVVDASDPDGSRKIIRQSIKKAYFPSGQLKRKYQVAETEAGERFEHGGSIEYYANGTIHRVGRYRYNLRDGTWFFNHANGSRAKKGIYLEGKPHGQWRVYSEEGKLMRLESFDRHRPHGKWVLYYDDESVKSETDFVAGKIHGKSLVYYPDGQLKASVSFEKGQEHGVTRRYFEDGKRMTVEHFKHGKRHGRSTSWFETGAVAADQMFEEGVEVPLPEGIGKVPLEKLPTGESVDDGATLKTSRAEILPVGDRMSPAA